MTTSTVDSGPSDRFSHELLLHDSDAELVDGTRAFVQQGLDAGGQVLVHGTEGRVAMLRQALGSPPGLIYGLDRDLYQSPTATLFRYQRALADSQYPAGLWATGTVPVGEDRATQTAWARYESLVNEVLGPYAFHGLCTYDTQTLPEQVIAAARATHPYVSAHEHHGPSPDYQEPSTFLADPLAGAPQPPAAEPALSVDLHDVDELGRARRGLRRGIEPGDVPSDVVDGLVTATNEVLTNALGHGAPPVRLEVWVEPFRVTCRVTDHGPGIRDLLSGYREDDRSGPSGLWAARRLTGDVVISNPAGGGCSVLLLSP